MRVTILGAGASSGTPAIDWGWGGCDPTEPRNRRTRPSILVEHDGTRLLIDTAPELRNQLLRVDVMTLDAVLYTHAHADHLHGIDDLRAINRATGKPLPCYADAATLETIRQRFGYVFEPLAEGARSYYKPTLDPYVLENLQSVHIGGVHVLAFEQSHGFSTTLGFRFGDVAYSTDVVELTERAFEALAGIKLWIIGTLVDHPHPTHCDVDKALNWIERIGPKQAVLSHLGNDLDYKQLAGRLPPGVVPAYDGLTLEA